MFKLLSTSFFFFAGVGDQNLFLDVPEQELDKYIKQYLIEGLIVKIFN
jgi:hypothetical protein